MSGSALLRLLCLAGFVIISFCQTALAADKECGNVWVLGQQHDQSGDFIVYIAPEAVKVVSLTNGGKMIAKGPDWRVVCFRPDDKIQWSTTLNTFQGLKSVAGGISSSGDGYSMAPKMTKVSSGVDHGVAYSKFTDLQQHFYWLADGIKTSPRAVEALCRYFSLPGTCEIILRAGQDVGRQDPKRSSVATAAKKTNAWEMSNLIRYDVSHKGNLKFETKSAKKIAYKAADFEIPKGYKSVQTLTEVLFSKSQKSDIEDFINDLGFTSTTKSKGDK
ncbi:MAG: hypothetical protein P4L53_10130 [Candidatus Obscuribacterales bacterium]|nr:hypothetical protein [Candidatus Obscuribacterales bacterium]